MSYNKIATGQVRILQNISSKEIIQGQYKSLVDDATLLLMRIIINFTLIQSM